MAKFLILADYTLEGVRGVQRAGGSARRDAVAAALETVGGKLEASTSPSATTTPT